MKIKFLLLLLLISSAGWAQDINIEYDKNRDFSKYTTFSFGESEIITPKDERSIDSNKLHGWVKEAITRELEAKGLKRLDSLGDLVASYVIGSSMRSEIENVGPLGGTPGVVAQPRSSMRDYNMGSFIIDLKDKSKNLVWRVNAETILISDEGPASIDAIVVKGFKKYGKPVKAEKEEIVFMYKSIIRPVLFLFNPEFIHHATFRMLQLAGKIPGFSSLINSIFNFRHPRLERTLFGLYFKNPVGLAAGFDKDARLIDEMASFGFGFIEIGTLTPKPQPGNDTPRLFRLPEDKALINRMGFNNGGVLPAIDRLKKRKSTVIVGGNIGKNKVTANEHAIQDYHDCFEALYPYVDYFVVNVSSPNTPGLRELQEKEPLRKLLNHVRDLSQAKEKPKPVLSKIAPDLTVEQLDDVIDILKETNTDGVIATNTTIARDGLITSHDEINSLGAGGLSGKPLAEKSTAVIKYLRSQMGASFPIIGVGGIMNEEDALEKLQAGADLIQLYTGFIYEGPALIRRINKRIIS